MSSPSRSYLKLETRFSRLSALSGAAAILQWDSAVIMPPGGSSARAEQMAGLTVLSHELLNHSETADLLDEAEKTVSDLDDWQRANLKEMRHSWRHATAIAPDLAEAHSRATSLCEMQWRQARHDNDFASLSTSLTEVVNLTQKIAAAKANVFKTTPYDALLDEYEPGCSSMIIDRLFADLEEFLPGFLTDVQDRQSSEPPVILPNGPFDEAIQKRLGRDFMTALGFDFNHGRLDVSHHPFTGGVADDVRLTTRYQAEDFTESLMGTLHETGHALYEQGLPKKWGTQPVGMARGMVLHESQSLLVEMQLSRGHDFMAFTLPQIKSAFNGQGPAWELENLQRLYLKVEPGLIRVDADEVTYPLHVILRYRLEKALLSGDLSVADLPGAWNSGMQSLLGITPPNDTMGCLQDIHWPSGAIGYFPTYTLGALAAAQIFQSAASGIEDFSEKIQDGRFEDLLRWLRLHIHSLGSSTSTDEILRAATGGPLGSAAFKTHLQARYLSR